MLTQKLAQEHFLQELQDNAHITVLLDSLEIKHQQCVKYALKGVYTAMVLHSNTKQCAHNVMNMLF